MGYGFKHILNIAFIKMTYNSGDMEFQVSGFYFKSKLWGIFTR